MKYIQVFESWLNEAEEAKFDPNKPQAFPMLKITQENLFNANEDIFRKVLASLFSRSLEKKETSIDWDFQFDFIYENGEINKNSIVFRDKIIAENEAKFGILQTAFASIILGGIVYFIYF